jgi:hypothetical protein
MSPEYRKELEQKNLWTGGGSFKNPQVRRKLLLFNNTMTGGSCQEKAESVTSGL